MLTVEVTCYLWVACYGCVPLLNERKEECLAWSCAYLKCVRCYCKDDFCQKWI